MRMYVSDLQSAFDVVQSKMQCKTQEVSRPCSICLLSQDFLIPLGETDVNNASLHSKLSLCVPEVEWSEEELICEDCVMQLETVRSFRKMCIYSHSLRFICEGSRAAGEEGNGSDEQRAVKISKRVKTFTCENCELKFSSSKKLVAHCISEHKQDSKEVRPFRCDKCENRFNTSSNLHQHMKYHAGDRSSVCSFCGKAFITKSDLSTHEKQHLNKREHECSTCSKRFNTRKDLRSHFSVVHSDPNSWKHVCEECGKRFPTKSNRDQHFRRHTGEKRFRCHLCDGRFTDKVVLKRHIASHSNVRAFRCEHCEKEYKTKSALEVHLKKAHGIGDAKVPVRMKKYFCGVCPKAYFARNKLTRHMYSHSGEKPFACGVCGKRFVDRSYVKQHLKNAHSVVDVDVSV